jgi:hypothetical protein
MDSLRDPTTSLLTIVPVTFSATRRRRLSDWRRVRVDGPLCHISGRGGQSSCAFHSAVPFFRLKGSKQKQPTTTKIGDCHWRCHASSRLCVCVSSIICTERRWRPISCKNIFKKTRPSVWMSLYKVIEKPFFCFSSLRIRRRKEHITPTRQLMQVHFHGRVSFPLCLCQ